VCARVRVNVRNAIVRGHAAACRKDAAAEEEGRDYVRGKPGESARREEKGRPSPPRR